MGSGTQGYQNALNYAMQLDACSFDVNLQILDSSENTAVAGTFAKTAAIIIAAVCFAVVLAAFPVKYKLMGLIADITVLFFAFVFAECGMSHSVSVGGGGSLLDLFG